VRESKIDARVEPTTAGPPTVILIGGGIVAGSRPDGGVMPSAVGPAAMGGALFSRSTVRQPVVSAALKTMETTAGTSSFTDAAEAKAAKRAFEANAKGICGAYRINVVDRRVNWRVQKEHIPSDESLGMCVFFN
jgi:hypothetical protein